MSSVGFSTGSKTENGVYLAFGIVVALAAVRLFSPQVLENPSTALAVVAFWGSVVASMAFLVRIDRVLTWSVRRAAFRRYGTRLSGHVFIIDIVLMVWRVATTDRWVRPDDKARDKLIQVIEGPDLKDDIWTMKGAFYFVPSLPLLFYAVGTVLFETWSLAIVLVITAVLVVWFNYRGFLHRCVLLAAFRYLQETRSVVELRTKHKGSTGFTVTDGPSTNQIVDDVLENLESMIEKHDWRGFARRVEYLLEDFEKELQSMESALPETYVKIWASVATGKRDLGRTVELVRMVVMKHVLRYGLTSNRIGSSSEGLAELLEAGETLDDPETLFRAVDMVGMRESFSQPLWSAFQTLSKPPVNRAIAEIVLKWYREGRGEFAEMLLGAAEYVDEPLRELIIQELIGRNAPETVWRQIETDAVTTLIHYPGGNKSRFLMFALRSGKRHVVSVILRNAKTDDYELVKEITSYMSQSDQGLVQEAVLFLFQVETATLSSFLLHLLKEEESAIRLNTARFLGRIFMVDKDLVSKEFQVIRNAGRPALSAALTDDNPGVRKIVVKAVEGLELSEKEVNDLKLLADSDPDSEVKFAARRVLGFREK